MCVCWGGGGGWAGKWEGNFENLDYITLNYKKGYTVSNPKSSVRKLDSSELLQNPRVHVMVEFYLFGLD